MLNRRPPVKPCKTDRSAVKVREVREVRDDLKVEALKCFSRHSSPKQGCIDYEDESKTIGRKIGVPQAHRQYLCHYCPAQAFVTHGIRKKKGMYD